jgi:LacI family transcriptional regulator
MTDSRPVSQRAIARQLGLSQATVSMALAGNPRVSAETREAVRAAAEGLAYRPDPALRSLARYRRAVSEPSYHATLAWVHAWQAADSWKSSAVFRVVFDAAAARAERLGFRLENFWIDPSEMSAARATQILRARGIAGLLLPPGFRAEQEPVLEWDHFSVVRLMAYPTAGPVFHLLASDHYASALRVFERLRELGYQRPGLLSSRHLERSLMHSYISAYQGWEALEVGGTARGAPPLWHEGLTRDGLKRWLKGHQVDVLVMSYAQEVYGRVFGWLEELGLRVPEDLGVAMLCLPDASLRAPAGQPADLSGIDENFADLGSRAVDLLVQTMENFERGVPEHPMRKLQVGRWHEGATVRAQG